MKSLLTILILGIVSFSFIQIEKDELPQYFWQLKDYDIPKALVYDTYINGIKSTPVYLVFERIGKKKLRLTKYNYQFKNTQIIEDVFKKDGVYLAKVMKFEDSTQSKMTNLNIKKGYIFPKNYENGQLSIEIEFESQLKNINTIEINSNCRLIDTTYINVNNQDLKTIIAEGESVTTIYENTKKQTIKEKVTTLYTKGIGITKIHQVSPYWDFEERYVKTISLASFNNLKIANKH